MPNLHLNPKMLAYRRGEKAYHDGKPRPQVDMTDTAWIGSLALPQCEYLGWMMARANALRKAERVRRYIECGDDL